MVDGSWEMVVVDLDLTVVLLARLLIQSVSAGS